MKPKLPALKLSTSPTSKTPPPSEKEALLPEGTQNAAGGVNQGLVGKNRKIMVIDDNPVVLKALELKLQASGFGVITATDGAQVVNTVQQENPVLIILDINFPPGRGASDLHWNGMTIMQWLARFLEGFSIPIIIVTGEEPSKQKDKFLAAGAVAFFQKPVDYQELLAAILKAIDAVA